MEHFYITTPIYYVNDKPHIGHAYTTIAADVMARFKRAQGFDVKFLTGTDEHGQKVDKSATAAGVTPQAQCDKFSQNFRDLVNTGENKLNITNDDFIRTTEPRHKEYAQEFWKKLESYGYIYKGAYEGWYSVRDEAYYQESELIDGKAPTGAEVEWVKEESYFFKLSEFQEPLLKFFKENPDFIQPQARFNEVISFVEGGLKDLSISRTTFDWGVPVPNDPDHVMYVWIDALCNYLTADQDSDHWNKGEVHHVVGKDIIRFHAVYWPAFLMGANIKVPEKIIAHGWWMIEGEKMSKSIGNVISPDELIEKYGIDYTRYFLLREVPFGNDGNFSADNLAQRVNTELANNIGNLAQRSISMIFKQQDNITPATGDIFNELQAELDAQHKQAVESYTENMNNYAFSSSLESITKYTSFLNEKFDSIAPWVVMKENPEDAMAYLYIIANYAVKAFAMLEPFVPEGANKMKDFLHGEYSITPDKKIEKPQGIFQRLQ